MIQLSKLSIKLNGKRYNKIPSSNGDQAVAPLERVGPTRQIIGTTCPGAGVTGLFDARLINCMGGQKRQEMAQEPRHDFQVKQLYY